MTEKKSPEPIYPESLFEYRFRLKYIMRTDKITQYNWFPYVDLICYSMICYRFNLCYTMLGWGLYSPPGISSWRCNAQMVSSVLQAVALMEYGRK